MALTLTPIAFGTMIDLNHFKPVKWKSLNYIEVIRVQELQEDWKKYNQYRKDIGLNEVTPSDFTNIRYNMTMHEYLTRPFDRLAYYRRQSKYNNNYKIRLQCPST